MPSSSPADTRSDGRRTDRPNSGASRRRFLAAGAAVTTACLAGCSLGTGPLETERSTNSYSVASGTAVAVSNANGVVTVEPTDAEDVEVQVVKRTRGERDRFDRVTLDSGVSDGTLELETSYDDGLSVGAVTVDLTVGLPTGHPLVTAETGNGDVAVSGVAGDADLRSGNGRVSAQAVDGYPSLETANGDVEATGTAGLAGARSGNGDVEVEVFALRDDVSFRTGNGSVDVGVPDDLGADVRLSVGNGEIVVEAVSLRERTSDGDRVTGRLGDGGPALTCEAGNGDVRLYGLDG